MSWFAKHFTPHSLFTPAQARRIRQAVMPFAEVEDYRGRQQDVRRNFRRLSATDKALLLLFVLNSILLIATALYVPTITTTAFFSLWQAAQFGFMLLLAFRFGRRKRPE